MTSSLKNLSKGSHLTLARVSRKGHKTQPPSRYTETKMVGVLEDKGIGRPSTYSSIVSTIQDRGYVQKIKGQQLAPTFKGFAVTQLLMTKLAQYLDYGYTATMEEKLEDIASSRISRTDFLNDFWNGSDNFSTFINHEMESLNWDDIKELTAIDLKNGYSITVSRFGTFLRDDNGAPNEKGFKPSVKIDDNGLVEDYRDREVCRKLLKGASHIPDSRILGTLTEGAYKGWEVSAKSGKFGPYAQAADPKGKKTVNQSLPKNTDLSSLTLSDVEELFSEVKLPRWSPDKKWFVGIGKRGPYMGHKTSPQGRATFKKLPENVDPRTVSFDDVKKLWNV